MRTPTLVATGVPRTYVSCDYCGVGLAAGPLGHRRSVTLWLERSRSGAASLGELAVDVLAGLLFGGQGHCGRVEAPCAFRKGSYKAIGLGIVVGLVAALVALAVATCGEDDFC